MQTEVYRRLQQQLDQYSIGFPPTESGIEIRLLQSMFTEDEAALFVELTAELEPAEPVARRMGRHKEEIASRLEAMALKGLLFRRREGGRAEYSAIPFIHGLLEFQVSRLSKETIKLAGQYINEKLKHCMSEFTSSFQRTIPVQRSVEITRAVAPYDDAREILRRQDVIVLTDCACRLQKAKFGKACDKPMEVCFMLGLMGEYYLENGLGRRVGLEEALRVLDRAQEAGLVTQPATARDPFTLCSCCGDCCGFLRAINKHPRPADFVFSNYTLAFDRSACSGCGKCVERCPMNANSLAADGLVDFDAGRCIGCGLCVTTCPAKCRVLVPKPEAELREPPAGTVGQMEALASRRGLRTDDPSRIVSFGFPNSQPSED